MVSAVLNSMGIRRLSSSVLPDVRAPPVSTTERGSGTRHLWFHPFGSEVGLDLEASVAGLQILSRLSKGIYTWPCLAHLLPLSFLQTTTFFLRNHNFCHSLPKTQTLIRISLLISLLPSCLTIQQLEVPSSYNTMQLSKSFMLLAALATSTLARPTTLERRQATGTSSGGEWTSTPSSGSYSTSGFGSSTASSGSGVTYAGNVGNPYGSNIIQVSSSDASQYKYVAQFQGSGTEQINNNNTKINNNK